MSAFSCGPANCGGVRLRFRLIRRLNLTRDQILSSRERNSKCARLTV